MQRHGLTAITALASLAIAASSALIGCSGSSEGAASSQTDDLQLDGPAVLSCTDSNDHKTLGAFAFDTSYVVTWQLGAARGKSTLIAADKDGDSATAKYTFRVATGEYFEINVEGNEVYFGHADTMIACASAASFKASLFDELVQATAESRAAQKDLATCTFDAKDGEHAPETSTLTTRPSLDGNGAILEGTVSDRSVAFLARTTSKDGVTFTGTGAETTFEDGEHDTAISAITLGESLDYVSTAATQLPTSSCSRL